MSIGRAALRIEFEDVPAKFLRKNPLQDKEKKKLKLGRK